MLMRHNFTSTWMARLWKQKQIWKVSSGVKDVEESDHSHIDNWDITLCDF